MPSTFGAISVLGYFQCMSNLFDNHLKIHYHIFMSLEEVKREIAKCAKCGKCRSVCPVFIETGDETRVARGRITLAEAIFQGEIFYSKELRDYIYSCKKCLRCQALCPSGVDFSLIVDALLEGIEKNMGIPLFAKFVLRYLLPRRRLFDWAIHMASWGQKIIPGEKKGNLRHLPLFFMGKRWVPHLTQRTAIDRFSETKRIPNAQMRVGFFAGCLINYVYPNIAESLIDVLNKLQIEVVVPPSQVCCGIPARSFGDTTAARILAEKNREVFEAEKLDAIVTACSTCLLTIKKEYLRLLGDSWRPMTEKMYDISVFLEKFTEYHPRPLDARVTYHDPCHLKWGLNTTKEPRAVLERCAELKEMEYADRCCGGGGIFSIIYRDLSLKIGEHKINSVKKSGAPIVATSCPGCVLQIADLAARNNLNLETVHVVELLSRTLNNDSEVPTVSTLVKTSVTQR